MVRSPFKVVLVAALAMAASASSGLAQAPAGQSYYANVLPALLQRDDSPPSAVSSSPAKTIGTAGNPDFESGWPRPSDLPASLYLQPLNTAPYACTPVANKYFESDPLLDPPNFPQPGFMGSIEIEAVGPHIFQSLSNGVAVGPHPPGTLHVPITPLNWTVSPTIELGYRLSSGFGAFAVNYQNISTTGSGSTLLGPNGGFASQHGRLNLNQSDIDYISQDFTPWEHWGMQWRFGFRQTYLFYDTTLTSPLTEALAGNGILQQSGTNGYRGWGGHIGVELTRDLYQQIAGLSFVGKVDFADTAGFVQQAISQTTTGGGFNYGEVQNGQSAPSLRGEFGFRYQPPGNRYDLFLGAFYQYWWNVGTLPNYALNAPGAPLSGGELSLTGVNFRFRYNY